MSGERRRSPRLPIRVFLMAEWKVGEETIVRNAVTESVNAHGALLELMAERAPVDRVTLVNVVNQQVQQHVRVVMVDGHGAGTYTLKVDFEASAPQFWGWVYLHSLCNAEGFTADMAKVVALASDEPGRGFGAFRPWHFLQAEWEAAFSAFEVATEASVRHRHNDIEFQRNKVENFKIERYLALLRR